MGEDKKNGENNQVCILFMRMYIICFGASVEECVQGFSEYFKRGKYISVCMQVYMYVFVYVCAQEVEEFENVCDTKLSLAVIFNAIDG